MDRARRAEPYSNATVWTREIARNMAAHLSRVSNAHSCVDTRSPKSIHLPKFQHAYTQKRCPTSPMKTRQPLVTIARNVAEEQEIEFRGIGSNSAREEPEKTAPSTKKLEAHGNRTFKIQAAKSTPKSAGMSTDGNQEDCDPPASLPTKITKTHHLTNGEVTTYNSPLVMPQHRHHLAHDYNRRQEQLKIWQENQALIKRLQSTKATLNSKEWQRDGKWTQDYLRNQERRRSAIQQQFHRAQASPHAVLRTKTLKALHPHHLKNIHHESHSEKNLRSPAKFDDAGTLSARETTRRDSKGLVVIQHATAANHRRIVELRKQKLLPVDYNEPAQLSPKADAAAEKGIVVSDAAMFIPGNEIVNVRFTFSRGNNRSHNGSTNISQQSEEVEALEIGTSERDVMSLSGAFSPGAELESALNSAAVDDAEGPDDITVPEVGGSTDTNNVTTTTQNDDELSVPVDSEQSPHDDGHPSDYPENKIPMVEQVEPTYSSVDTKDIISIPAEQSNREKNSEDEDEAYDGDDFDPCPSARYNDDTTPENEDKIEASGYGSEFEDDTFNVDLKAFSPRVGGNNQENDEEGEVSYSHDGFVD